MTILSLRTNLLEHYFTAHRNNWKVPKVSRKQERPSDRNKSVILKRQPGGDNPWHFFYHCFWTFQLPPLKIISPLSLLYADTIHRF